LHLFKYGYNFARLTDDELTIVPLISKQMIDEFNKIFSYYHKNNNVQTLPIYLKTSNRKIGNLFNPFSVLHDFFNMCRIMNKVKPDVVINFYVLDSFPLVFLKKIFNYSLIVVALGGDINLHENLPFNLIRKIIFKCSSLIFSVSKELQEKIYDESKRSSVLLPTGIDTNFFKSTYNKLDLRYMWNIDGDDYVMSTVCTLDKNKSVDTIIKSMSLIINNHNNLKFIIAGNGPEKNNLVNLSKNLRLEKNIEFLGFTSRDKILELYNLSDLFLLASFSEGLPAALLEAMACRCVCLTTDVGDIPRVIKPEFNGFLFSPGDAVSLSKYIEYILSYPEDKLDMLMNNARIDVVKNYDIEYISSRFVSIISSYLKSTNH